jgi:hypothetical protein
MQTLKDKAGILLICLTILGAVLILGNAYKYKYRSSETISVTGLSEKEFSSDRVVWGGSFVRTDLELRSAYAQLKQDESAIRAYLNSKGIPDSNIVFTSVNMSKNYSHQYDDRGYEISSRFAGYTLSEDVRVESGDIDRVETLSREITELLEKGIELNSYSPEYYYTKLNALKIDLLARASADAKKRAETIAANSGTKVVGLKKASMGVFQITGKNENENFSYGGTFNTASREKKASITIKVEYRIR